MNREFNYAAGRNPSAWLETEPLRETEPLTQDTEADVCVVGAGIAGMSAAYMLRRAGLDVIVLDDGPVGGGNTARTTAHLSCVIDDRFSNLEQVRGKEAAKLAAESHAAAIETIAEIAEREGIACDFERLDGYLVAARADHDKLLMEELKAARRAGLGSSEWTQSTPFGAPAIRFPDQAQFHPLKYLNGLLKAVTEAGSRVFTGTHVSAVHGGSAPRVETNSGHAVRSSAVVVATNTPINDRVAIHTKQAPYLTYAIAGEVPRGALERALYWDTLDPYHYLRLHPYTETTELLIVGGEDHKTGQAQDAEARYQRLEGWARKRVPQLGLVSLRWSGQVYETLDGLGYIGRDPAGEENVYIATGDSGMGMTHGTIAGLLLRDLILGEPNPWEALYDPARKPVKALREFARENVNVAAQYADWLEPGEVKDPSEVPPGGGALLRRGLGKLALYRDDDGQLHERSAVCPHLGCVVAWNADERSWDCPCHGSRFDPYGRVFNGPANTDLAETG